MPCWSKSITGKEHPEGVGVVGLHNVWSLGRVARTGLPLIESVITLGSYTHSGNYIVKEGSMLGELLEFAHITLNSGDTLVRGGPLRGEASTAWTAASPKGSTGVFVVEAGTVPPMEGHSPCINCGACVLIRPARLSPSMLSRNAEFAPARALPRGTCGLLSGMRPVRLCLHRPPSGAAIYPPGQAQAGPGR